MRRLHYLSVALCIAAASLAVAQDAAWRAIANWAKLPDGRTWGSTSTLDVDRSGNV